MALLGFHCTYKNTICCWFKIL